MAGHRGSCLCGEVAYEVDGPLEHAHHCHCSYCRKIHGTPYATGALAPRAALAARRAERRALRVVARASTAGSARAAGRRCRAIRSRESTFIPFGTLDGDPGVRPAFHMFAASKAPWWEIRDGLPAFDAFPPGIDAPPVAPIARCATRPARRAAAACAARSRSGSRASRSWRAAATAGAAARRAAPRTRPTCSCRSTALRFTRGEGELASLQDPGGEVLHAGVLPDLWREGAARRHEPAGLRSCRWARSTTTRASP